MKITVETDNRVEMDQLMQWLKERSFLEKVEITATLPEPSTIIRGDKSVDPRGLEGMWKHNPRILEGIRKAAWA